ncbi:MAG: hypothetical protein DVB28_000854 [Verrucomicrobia bacterium]|nr:MAG: hypothetical protein DVB28_000854 [Verrucomicrobiota bacterium]
MFVLDAPAWAQQLAAKLRLLHADLAGVGHEQRGGFLQQEIRRALEDIVPERRKEYMEALAPYFPQGENSSPVAVPAVPGLEAPLTPEELLANLVRIAPLLPKRKLESFSLELQKAGYLPLETTALIDAPPEDLRGVFPMEEGRQVDLQRLYRLVHILGEFYVSLDKVTWNIWRALAPKSTFRKENSPLNDVSKMGGRYLTGDSEVSAEQLKQITGRLRQLLAGVLTAIGPAGRSFAQKHLARFSPDAIRDIVNQEAGFFSNLEQKCWRKYSELNQELSADGIEGELQEAIARYTENLIRGISRPPDA